MAEKNQLPSIGRSDIEERLKLLYPQLSKEELEDLIDSYLDLLVNRLAQGYKPAFARLKPNGTLDLKVLESEGKFKSRIGGGEFENDLQILRILQPVDNPVYIQGFSKQVIEPAESIDFIYSIYYIFILKSEIEIRKYIKPLREIVNRLGESRIDHIPSLSSINPDKLPRLRLISVNYGSPASIDLLGVGKVLEVLRDTIKDILWRGKHEKGIAELELKNKEEELQKQKLETEKLTLDIAEKKINIEKSALEVVRQKLDVLERINGLQLLDEERQVVTDILLPHLLRINTLPETTMITLVDSRTSMNLDTRERK